MTSPLAQKLKVALIQFSASLNKQLNLAKVTSKIETAVKTKDVNLIVLPECFNSPYLVNEFANYAEAIPGGETTTLLSDLAKKFKIFIVGGSIPERSSDNKIYNTSISFNPLGEIIAKHRKLHLFDIDIPNKITFKESLTLTGGDKATVFNLKDYGSVGLGICYDIRFPELAQILARSGSFAMIYPGAFNTTTGPLHWHLLARSRAVDNQVYVIVCSPARDLSSGYHAYGHSLIVNPNGEIIAEAGEGEEIVYAELDPEVIESIRGGIPVTQQRRFDVYKDVSADAKVDSI